MKDKPIIMSAESVRAILAGNKTQTRRVVALPDNYGLEFTHVKNVSENPNIAPLFKFSADSISRQQLIDGALPEFFIRSPYQIGQRLWVREKCLVWHNLFGEHLAECSGEPAAYTDSIEWDRLVSDGKAFREAYGGNGAWRVTSPIHMPRWASRLTLEVTDIRCERLQEITEEDAVAEGITERYIAKGGAFTRVSKILHEHGEVGTLRNGYAVEWTNLNTKRGYPRESSPFVWVIEFKVVTE